ncbi:SPS1, Serine threonine kinase [Lecanosticta acicola]|uniref:SPS1, Serine threonine kinase n=1 Tax=Lecanosticta acicola TaxID=111012 RepID=A0AAI9EBK5_9PEZI|nr:SPS1, Serine threonine kinase [Lecanosticta acicola]
MSYVSGASQPDHSQALQELLQWIERRSISSYDIETGAVDSGRVFMPNTSVENYFQEHNCKRTKDLLAAVYPDEDAPPARDIAETCPRIFCILTLISKTKYIRFFTKRNTLLDNRLPFEARPKDFPTSPSDPSFFENFKKHQWRFCAPDLEGRSGRRFDDEEILPISELKKAGGGGSATVYKATIHTEHDRLRKAAGNCYALKTFRPGEDDFQREVDAFDKITGQGMRTTENIIEFCGAFEYRETLNIVLEYAEGGTLEQYSQTNQPPSDGKSIIDFWEAIFGLCHALHRIHESHLPPGVAGRRLVLQGSGTRTYGAPECYAESSRTSDRQNIVKRSIDIWSLGGIYSETAVWVVSGYTAIEEYRHARKRATDQLLTNFRDGDAFHDGSRRLPIVDQQHDYLRPDMHPDDFLTGHALFVIGKEMLHSSPASRPSAEQLVSKAEDVVKEARKLLNEKTSRDSFSGQPSSLQGSPSEDRFSPSAARPHLAQDPEYPERPGLYSTPRHTNNFPSHHVLANSVQPRAGPSVGHHDQEGFAPQVNESITYPNGASNHTINGQSNLPFRPAPPGIVTQRNEEPPKCTVGEAWEWYHDTKYGKDVKLPHDGLTWELEGRDHVFIIDDSRSMQPYWREVERLAQLLAFITKRMDRDGLELYFLTSERGYKCSSSSRLARYIRDRAPDKMTNLNSRLAADLRSYREQIDRIRSQTRTRRTSLFGRPGLVQRSIYVFTDGVWESGEDEQGQEAIFLTANKLAETGLERKQIGIQFIRFGESEVGRQRLEALDNLNETHNLAKDIVDTEPANGNVWKMLLGAINPKFDNDPRRVSSPTMYGG